MAGRCAGGAAGLSSRRALGGGDGGRALRWALAMRCVVVECTRRMRTGRRRRGGRRGGRRAQKREAGVVAGGKQHTAGPRDGRSCHPRRAGALRAPWQEPVARPASQTRIAAPAAPRALLTCRLRWLRRASPRAAWTGPRSAREARGRASPGAGLLPSAEAPTAKSSMPCSP
ncbi:hypothetical protein BDY21DRAFT_59182 [Lineolata rhizophorae]|uniref:Uncharacterized protein n=1 Tax=Lineolata rhizophorae TaxID=578093 RepID=A0A6A6NX04_9PEZI|nr:hypothetical protein BDY21DRAFT_59182 [Lineolata rhizophorae]